MYLFKSKTLKASRLERGLAAVAFIVLIPGLCQAQQRPLVTEDPETIGLNRILVEGGVEFDKSQLYSAYGVEGDTVHGLMFGVSVGLSPTIEVQVDGGLAQRLSVTRRQPAPLSHLLTFTGDEASTVEDFTIATKIRLAPEIQTRPALGVRFGTRLPTARREEALGLGTTDFFVGLLAGKTIRSFRAVGNVSFVVLGNPQGAQEPVHGLGYGVSIARAVTNAFEVVGEVNGRPKPWGDAVPAGLEGRSAMRIAGRYTARLLRLDAGVVIGLTSRDPNFGISAGVTYVISR